jgi:hypothetical protein
VYALVVLNNLDEKAKADELLMRIKIATYGADPERFADIAFPEWKQPEEVLTDLDDIRNITGPVEYDLTADDIMTPEKMNEIMKGLSTS